MPRPPPPPRLPKQAALRPRPPFINLSGDYRFLRGGYWALVDAELNGIESRPSPMQAATAQNCAATLLVAQHHGIPCVDWKVARKAKDVVPPSILVPNAGHTDTYYHCESPRSAASQWRSATQNGTRPALVVKKEGTLRSIKQVVGMTMGDHFQLAWKVWQVFGVPLSTIWYLDSDAGPLFLSLDPLPLHELTERELRLFEEVSQRPMSPS